ncbi:MAG: DNA primase [Thiomargarita sp.]|nr:DNA primase [Thiomargarita sp.]
MRIPRSFIDDLMTRVDIVDLIESYVSLRKTGQNYTALCPFHHEKTPSFTVSPDKQFFYCFGCGAHGTAIGFLIDHAQLNFVEAIQELASRVGMDVVYEQGTAPVSVAAFDDLYQVMAQAAHYYRQQLRLSPKAITYLKKRGITGEIARDFGLGYAPPAWDNLLKTLETNADMHSRLLKTGLIKQHQKGHYYDHFRDRIMFPIFDRRGRVIAFGGRTLSENTRIPKYLNSPETPLFQKSRELYGWSFAQKIKSTHGIIIVEGYMDVIALVQYAIPYVVAALGTATTREHVSLLFRRVSTLIFCFDGDTAGRNAAWKALNTVLPLLQAGRQVSFILLPQGDDPDNLIRLEGTDHFNQRIKQAIPLSEFFFNTLTQQVDITHIDGQARLVSIAKPLLMHLPDGPYRELMFQKLSDLTRVNLKNFTTLIHKDFKKNTNIQNRQRYPVEYYQSVRDLSAIEQAIVCLLHKPMLSVEYPHQKLAFLKQQDIKLLLNLIEFTRKNPTLTLGRICEHWRGTEYEQTINQLATQKPLFTETDINIDEEFRGAIKQLYKDYVTQRQAQLQEKIMDLTVEERQELSSLFQFMNN